MNKIICKPCFAFEALASLVFCNYCSSDIPGVKEWVEKTYSDIDVGPSNAFFDILIRHHSLEEIDSMDIDDLLKVYPSYLKDNDWTARFAEAVIKGLQQLKASDFELLWYDTLLPILNKQCESFLNACESKKVDGVLRDVEVIQGKPIGNNIVVYMTHFTCQVSFILTPACYLTHGTIGEEFDTGSTLALFAHELCHRFSRPNSVDAYKKLCEGSDYLKRSWYFLSNIVGESSYEEEFVMAIEGVISLRQKLRNYDAVIYHLSTMYRNSIPIAIILFSRLALLDDLPSDINEWICEMLTNEIKSSDIEKMVDSIVSGYTDKFNLIWSEEKSKRPELFKEC